jgi:hypothetical protein
VLERDGAYPPFEELLAEIDAARLAVRRGRECRACTAALPAITETRSAPDGCDAEGLEALLAQAYVDGAARTALARDPTAAALAAGLDRETAEALARMDRPGLLFAARSFARKRALKARGS